MSGLIDAIFKPEAAKVQGPSKEEIAAQEKEERILKLQARERAAEAGARSNIITARAAGPQTLFTTGANIPQKLSGAQ